MPIIDERWQELNGSDWESLARAWLAELRGAQEGPSSESGLSVAMMNFTAAPEHQWKFILAVVALAETDEDLGHIAAGPVEHLLSWHGSDSIEAVEAQAAMDPKFARVLGGVWKHLMSEEVWQRVQALKLRHLGKSDQAPSSEMPGSEPADLDALSELAQRLREALRRQLPALRSNESVDQAWLKEFEALIDAPLGPLPVPPRLPDDEDESWR